MDYDLTDDHTGVDLNVLGLYAPDVAAAAALGTASDPGSGPTTMDD